MEMALSLFDRMEVRDLSILELAVKKGSGFVDGKKRINKLSAEESDKVKRAKAIKDEYGIGGMHCGMSWYREFGFSGIDHDSIGLRISFPKETGKSAVDYSWSQVEEAIGTLISEGLYD